jgi:hypothetical protein
MIKEIFNENSLYRWFRKNSLKFASGFSLLASAFAGASGYTTVNSARSSSAWSSFVGEIIMLRYARGGASDSGQNAQTQDAEINTESVSKEGQKKENLLTRIKKVRERLNDYQNFPLEPHFILGIVASAGYIVAGATTSHTLLNNETISGVQCLLAMMWGLKSDGEKPKKVENEPEKKTFRVAINDHFERNPMQMVSLQFIGASLNLFMDGIVQSDPMKCLAGASFMLADGCYALSKKNHQSDFTSAQVPKI